MGPFLLERDGDRLPSSSNEIPGGWQHGFITNESEPNSSVTTRRRLPGGIVGHELIEPPQAILGRVAQGLVAKDANGIIPVRDGKFAIGIRDR